MATVSTVDTITNTPQSALVAFAETNNLEILFETFVETRKYQNLQANNKVSFTIGWDPNEQITVQYEGEAQLVEKEQIEDYRKIFLAKKTPCTKKFLLNPRARLYKVTPIWIRYSDYKDDQPIIIEIRP